MSIINLKNLCLFLYMLTHLRPPWWTWYPEMWISSSFGKNRLRARGHEYTLPSHTLLLWTWEDKKDDGRKSKEGSKGWLTTIITLQPSITSELINTGSCLVMDKKDCCGTPPLQLLGYDYQTIDDCTRYWVFTAAKWWQQICSEWSAVPMFIVVMKHLTWCNNAAHRCIFKYRAQYPLYHAVTRPFRLHGAKSGVKYEL